MKSNSLSNVIYHNNQGEGDFVMNAGCRGSIVNISSVCGLTAKRESVAYNASKGALEQMTKSCAVDFAKFKIRVNGVAPGVVETQIAYDQIRKANMTIEEGLKLGSKRNLFNRYAAPQEVAKAVVFLASDQFSSFITGITLSVDGGELIKKD